MNTLHFDVNRSNLKQQAIRGSFFQVIGRFLLRFLKVIRTIVVARFLFPDDVGLFVLASSLLGVAELFLQSGFQAALVQWGEIERRHLDGVWTVHCAKNLLLGIVVYGTAPFCASFFDNDALIPILQALALLYVIESFVNIGTILIQKEMQFGKQLLYDASYVVTELVATVVLAYFLRDVWALVYGTIIGRLASVVFSYVFHEYRPKFTKDFSGVQELFTFGRWIWLTSIFIFIASKLDSFFIGKFLSVKDLGFYQLALSLALLPAVEVSRSLATVLFPLFSKIQKNSELVYMVVIQAFKMIGLVTIPMAVGLYVLSEQIVQVIYGITWEPVVPILKILSILGLLKSFEYVFISFINSSGKPKIVSYSTIFQAIFLAVFLHPSIQMFGILGVAIVLCVGTFLSILYFLVVSVQVLDIRGGMSLIHLGIPMVASLCMGGILFSLEELVGSMSIVALLAYIFVGVVVYTFFVFSIDWYTGKQYYQQIDNLTNGTLSRIRECIIQLI